MDFRVYSKGQIRVRNLTWGKGNRIPCDRNIKVIKLYKKGSLLGSVYVANDWIFSLVVNPKHRGKGYGAALLNVAEKEIFKKHKVAYLRPQDNDPKLRKYYVGLGYSGFDDSEPGYEEEDKTWWTMTKRKD